MEFTLDGGNSNYFPSLSLDNSFSVFVGGIRFLLGNVLSMCLAVNYRFLFSCRMFCDTRVEKADAELINACNLVQMKEEVERKENASIILCELVIYL